MGQVTDLAVSAILLAGLYATMAYGLGLIYGVLRVVNLNHGGIIMAGAAVGGLLREKFGVEPYPSIPVGGAVAFLLGPALFRGLGGGPPRPPAGRVAVALLP